MNVITYGLTTDLQVSTMHQDAWQLPPFKIFSLFFCIVFFCCIQTLHAQGSVKYSVTTVTDSRVYYQIADSLYTVSIHDKIKLLPEIEVDSTVNLVYMNNDIKTTIFHQNNSRVNDWMTRPVKTIIDKSRIKMYDRFGATMLNELHSVMYKQNYMDMKNYLTTNDADIIPSFIPITATLKQSLIESGFVYTNRGNNYHAFEKDTLVIVFNNTLRSNEFLIMHSDGSFNYSLKKGFKVNDVGQIVPSYVMERKWDERFPSQCVQKFSVTEYPFYKIKYFGPGKFEDPDAEENMEGVATLTISPNPAANSLQVLLPDYSQDLIIEVYDNTGRLVFRENSDKNINTFSIALTAFKSGMYLLKVYNDTIHYTESFIKN